MYGIRHIPVHWLVGFFNIMSVLCDAVYGSAERTWSFFSTIFWNLTGLDQYYIFQDVNPAPIPYRSYMFGGLGDREWYYNVRTRIFELHAKGISRKFLPALAIEFNQRVEDNDEGARRIIYDLTKWVDSVTFKSFNGVFPHPMQLVAAWSLHSGVWPSFHNDDENRLKLTMMCGEDGNSYDVPIGLTASPFSWRRFAAGNEGSSTEDSETSDDSEEEATDDSEESETTEEEATDDSEEGEDSEEEDSEGGEDSEEEEEESEASEESDAALPNGSEKEVETESSEESESEEKENNEGSKEETDSTDSATGTAETQVTEIKETKSDSPVVLEDTTVGRNYFEEVD